MPTSVLKVAPDQDLYVGWSTVVDNAIWTGNRDEALRILRREAPRGYYPQPGHSPEDRLRRADETGTSALWPKHGGYFGGWDDSELMVEQRGLLRRADLRQYLDLLAADEEAAFGLLQPFDDEAPTAEPKESP